MPRRPRREIDDRNFTLAKISFDLTNEGYKWLVNDPIARKQFNTLRIDAKHFHALAQQTRERFDSYRVLLLTVPTSENSDIAAALLSSLRDHVSNVEHVFTHGEAEMTLHVNAIRYEETLRRFFTENFSLFSENLSPEDVKRLRSAALANLERAKKLAPGPIVYQWILRSAVHLLSQVRFRGETGKTQIIRELHFAPEHQQAGIGILNYFAQVLAAKYPDEQVALSIRQLGNLVTMHITTPDGLEEEISQTLDDYGLVVVGKKTPEEFLGANHHALALQAKLDMAHLEIRTTERLLASERANSKSQIARLERDVDTLFSMVQEGLTASKSTQARILEFLTESHTSALTQNAVRLLTLLAETIAARDEQRTRIALDDLKRTEPSLFNRVTGLVTEGALTGVIGNAVYDWLKILWPILPK